VKVGIVTAAQAEVDKASHTLDVSVFERVNGVVEVDFPRIVDDGVD
jgi:hypothetical protein